MWSAWQQVPESLGVKQDTWYLQQTNGKNCNQEDFLDLWQFESLDPGQRCVYQEKVDCNVNGCCAILHGGRLVNISRKRIICVCTGAKLHCFSSSD